MLHDRDYMRDSQPPRWKDIMLPDAVTVIIAINILVFLLQIFGYFSDKVVVDGRVLGSNPWGAFSLQALMEGRVWTLFTHMFVHGSPFHILANCLMIGFSGKALQSLLGQRTFLMIYFTSGVAGAALELLVGQVVGNSPSMIGASACASGIFVAVAAMLPQQMITALIAFIIPVNMRFWRMAMLFMGVSLLLGLLQAFNVWDTGIAHFAHLGGALAGWACVRLLGHGGPPVTYERLWQERQRREEEPEYAAVSSRKREQGSNPPVIYPVVDSKKEFIAREIDPLLDKIVAHGLGSLSKEERELLERAHIEITNRERKS